MITKRLVGSAFLAGLLFVGHASAAPLHRGACEKALGAELQVCWDAVGEEGEEFGPFLELHMMPISWDHQGDAQLLADYTRSVFRQLLPSGLSKNLIQEWTPATNLEGAIKQIHRYQWPYTLWISPRMLRAGSAMSSGVVDWDAYIMKSNRLLRTLRIRVESHPKRADKSIESGTAVGALLTATGAVGGYPLASTAAVAAAMATAQKRAPEAGRSLELMTELAVRQIILLFQYPMEELRSTPSAEKNSVQKVTNWIDTIFSPQ